MARTVKAPDERRSEFIATAQQLFYTQGYERTSVNDIINAVGVSKGAFYHYFDSKQAILEAVVETLLAQSSALMQTVVDDPTLDAIAKFNHFIQTMNNWKIEQRQEMLGLARLLRMDENLRLRHQLDTEGTRHLASTLSQIIGEGIAEGVFRTEFAQDAAQYTIAIVRVASDACTDMLLESVAYEDPAAAARSKLKSAQTAIERLLGAPNGSLPLASQETIDAWFVEE